MQARVFLIVGDRYVPPDKEAMLSSFGGGKNLTARQFWKMQPESRGTNDCRSRTLRDRLPTTEGATDWILFKSNFDEVVGEILRHTERRGANRSQRQAALMHPT